MSSQAAVRRSTRRTPARSRKSSGRRSTAARKRSRKRRNDPHRRELIGLGMVGFGVLLGLAVMGAGGPIGHDLVDLVRVVVGRAVWLAAPVLIVMGVLVILSHPLLKAPPLRLGAALAAAAALTALASGILVGGPERAGWFETASVQERGGHLGEALYFSTSSTVGDIGTSLLVVIAAIAAAILISGASLAQILQRSGEGAVAASRSVGRGVASGSANALREGQKVARLIRGRIDPSEATTLVPRRTRPAADRADGVAGDLLDGADLYSDIYAQPGEMPPPPAFADDEPEQPSSGLEPDEGPSGLVQPELPLEPVAEAVPDEADDDELDLNDLPRTDDAPAYRLPSNRLLTRSRGSGNLPASVVEETSRALEEALGHFGVEANVTDAISGPRVTRYELQLAPGTKVGRVSSLRDDLAYALAATDEIRIIAPIPGKQAVGVEVPNPESTTVTLGDIYREFPDEAGPLMTWLGLDISGKPVYMDIARMPHLLIAGSTGTGKSVCLNALLASILLRATPDELRMILVDPKKVELNHYESIPHLLTPVVTGPKEAAAVLANIVREMENRYELMGMARARNLRDWNEERVRRGERPMPAVLVVIDELADLMMVAPAEVEDAIIRLAQKSRAVGIHLVLATQRPSVDVITGMIKANVPSRIAFAVSSQVDSRVVLDSGGAESLLGQGDMLFRPVGTSRLQRLQGAYVSENEIRSITEHWRRQGKPSLREELLERPEPAEEAVNADGDELLNDAIALVVQQGTASVSLLQRRLGVGYARAGRLVDQLEERGVVSGHEGSKPRRVLVGEADLPRLTGVAEESEDPEPAA
jgi:S-DNA-T family DNA segregation ATPase FtsK/SpoIIIE